MTERERFEEWIEKKSSEWALKKEASLEYSNSFVEYGWQTWQARAEIAKQDEKKLIEALIKEGRFIEKSSGKNYCDRNDMDKERLFFIPIIEKHTGKTWEELNG